MSTFGVKGGSETLFNALPDKSKVKLILVSINGAMFVALIVIFGLDIYYVGLDQDGPPVKPSYSPFETATYIFGSLMYIGATVGFFFYA